MSTSPTPERKGLVCQVAAAFATGVAAALMLTGTRPVMANPLLWLLLLCLSALYAWGRGIRRLPPARHAPTAALLFVVALGGLHFSLQWQLWQRWQNWLSAQAEVVAIGEVRYGYGDRMLFYPQQVCAASGAVCLEGRQPRFWLATGAGQLAPAPGRYKIRARFLPAKPPRIPGGFDELQYDMRNNVAGTVRVVEALASPPDRADAQRTPIGKSWRQWLLAGIPGTPGQIAAAITLGDATALDQETIRILSWSGLFHIASVSGMHVGMVLAAVGFVLGGQMGWRAAAGLVVAGAFTLLAGGRPSAIRAFLAAVAWCVGRACGYAPEPWTVLATALLALLVANPATLTDRGLILSFAAMSGIFLIARPLLPGRVRAPGVLAWLRRWAWSLMALTIGAQAGTLMFQVAFFNYVSLVGLPASLAGTPLSMAVLIGGLTGCLLHACRLDWLASLCLGVTGQAARGFLAVAAYFGNMRWAVVHLATPAFLMHVAWWSGLVGISYGLYSRFLPAGWRSFAYRAAIGWSLAGCAVAILPLCQTIYENYRLLRITFIDVGQGDAILIQAPRGRAVLVDAGNKNIYVDSSRTVLELLRRLGAGQLAAAVNTHPHSDHLGGLAGVLAGATVETVWDTGATAPSAVYAAYQEAIARAEIPHRLAARGDSLQLGRVKIEVLWPPAGMARQVTGSSALNDISMVLRIAYGRVVVLLMGDATQAAQAQLLADLPVEEVALWTVPHQGAATCCQPAFVAAAHPHVSVVSVGPNNYGHPNPLVMAQLSAAGVVCRTDVNGTVRFSTDGRWWRVQGMRGPGCRAGER